jgi:hypothetical protein
MVGFSLAGVEEDVLAHLATLRQTLATSITKTPDVKAARDAITRVLERFAFFPGGPDLSRSMLYPDRPDELPEEPIEASLLHDWYIRPVPRADAILIPRNGATTKKAIPQSSTKSNSKHSR